MKNIADINSTLWFDCFTFKGVASLDGAVNHFSDSLYDDDADSP